MASITENALAKDQLAEFPFPKVQRADQAEAQLALLKDQVAKLKGAELKRPT